MYRSLKTRHLAFIFLTLLLVFGLVELRDYLNRDRSLRALVMSVDTSKISGIVISSVHAAQTIELSLHDSIWTINHNGQEYVADQRMVHNILWRLVNLKPEWLAATGKEQWNEFQVSDSLATRVLIKVKKSKKTKTLLIGKISYQAPKSPYEQGAINSYVRLDGENKVYAVQGFLRMDFPADVNSYRPKNLVSRNAEQWTRLTFAYPADSSFILEKRQHEWFINNQQADSIRMMYYLQDLSKLSGTHFADTLAGNKAALLTLTIEGNNMQPVVLSAFASANATNYLIHSSFNAQAWFTEDKNTLSSRIFKSKSYFLKSGKVKK